MERINVKDIIIGQNYYSICCGEINKIIFIEINIPKVKLKYVKCGFISNEFLSDLGIEYPNESYINKYNFVFKTLKEAKDLVNSHEYKCKMEEKREDDKILDGNY